MPQKIVQKTASHWDKINSLYDKYVDGIEKRLGPVYSKQYGALLEKIRDLYDQIMANIANGTMIASDIHRYKKYIELVNEIHQRLGILGAAEKDALEKTLFDFYRSNEALLQADFKIPPISDEAIKNVIGQVWASADNLLYSDRIWKHMSQLQELLTDGLTECVVSGQTADQLTGRIQDAFSVSWNQAKRIVRTELSHIQTVSHLNGYERIGIEWYKILVSDLGPCPICEELAKHIWPVSER